MNNSKRSATLKCKENCSLVEISKELYNKYMSVINLNIYNKDLSDKNIDNIY